MSTKPSILRSTLLCLLALLSGSLLSQQVSVYKIGDLMKRIHNTGDTIYVVNFWATWCKPCVAELPDFEQFGEASKNSKVKVLLVSMDFKEDLEKKLMPFLRKNNYSSEVVLLDELNGNSFINQVSKEWTGAIPATLITTGNKQHAFFEKKMTKESLAAAVTEISNH